MRIPPAEFQQRIERAREHLAQRDLDALLVYGDEYRKEHLRYVSNYWPIFERAATVISLSGPTLRAGGARGRSGGP